MENITFEKRDHLISLCKFHHSGNELIKGMKILIERNYRSPLSEAEFVSAKIGEVKMDITGYGKYSESSCVVIENGETKSWPFSMIYLKP